MTRPDRYKTVSRCVDILDGGEDYDFNNPYVIIKKEKE